MSLALAVSALAAQEGFRPVADAHGCVIYAGEVEGGLETLRAECHWPDASFEVLAAALSRVDAWEHLVWCIADAEQVGVDGDRALVWQRHEVSPLAPRESLLWIRASGDWGHRRWEWTMADEPHAFGADAVIPLRNDGWWEISRAEGGGVDVVHQVTYDPAGQVPGWLIRWFQRRGAVMVMADVHALARR